VEHRAVDRTRRFYDTVATAYAEMIPDTRYESAIDLAMVRDFVDLLPDDHKDVLDAGCGTGRMIGHLHALDPQIVPTGLDLSPAMLDVAKTAHPGIRFVEGSLAELPFDDGSFAGILAWYSIIHTAPHDLARVFEDFRRVLRPGGLALIGFQSGVGERTAQGAYGHDIELHAHLHDEVSVSAALESAGLTVDTRLTRGPRDWEHLPQAFVLARRVA
jgi:ubiquinone/menaquinone biosynthesis C-methylase UbiE